jgi:hypothetical protein
MVLSEVRNQFLKGNFDAEFLESFAEITKCDDFPHCGQSLERGSRVRPA